MRILFSRSRLPWTPQTETTCFGGPERLSRQFQHRIRQGRRGGTGFPGQLRDVGKRCREQTSQRVLSASILGLGRPKLTQQESNDLSGKVVSATRSAPHFHAGEAISRRRRRPRPTAASGFPLPSTTPPPQVQMIGLELPVSRHQLFFTFSRQFSQINQFLETFVYLQISFQGVSRARSFLDQTANPLP